MFQEKPKKQPIEHLGTPNKNKDKETSKNKKEKPQDTLFYKKEGEMDKKRRGVRIDEIREDEEGDKEKEELKLRFIDLEEKLIKGEVSTEIVLAGEKQNLQITGVRENGKQKKPEELTEDIEKLDLNKIEAKFNLQWIEGKGGERRTLTVDCTVPIINILEGKGDMSKRIEKNVTEIFAGTSKHYQKIRELEKDGKIQKQEKLDESTYKQQKQDIIDHLKKQGLRVTTLESEERLTIIAEHPKKGTQILVSLMSKQPPWHVEGIRKNEENQSSTGIISGQPQEAISNVNKLLKENQ